MQAVIETGGKQYRVEPGDVIDVELTGGAEEGSEVTFDRVLLVHADDGVKSGDQLAGASVTGVLLDRVRGPKIRVFKFKRRKGYRRTTGHRQDYHRVRVDTIHI
ncbi:MAG TPA: 50S ribosomal protein L21 [Thermoanaerobaculia bacterium]|nr:50S ribosomal protein L21 [Thermoanaerobaculia bacterium]